MICGYPSDEFRGSPLFRPAGKCILGIRGYGVCRAISMKRLPVLFFAIPLSCTLSFALLAGVGRSEPPASFDPRLLDNLILRSIGPANMGGRIVDLAVVENKPAIMYVAAASGGLWKTVNNGTTWQAVFENESTSSLGAVAVAPS